MKLPASVSHNYGKLLENIRNKEITSWKSKINNGKTKLITFVINV